MSTRQARCNPLPPSLRTADFLATIYRHLGIDPRGLEFQALSGRPIPVPADGAPLAELARRVMLDLAEA
jgi:hypothetical protein